MSERKVIPLATLDSEHQALKKIEPIVTFGESCRNENLRMEYFYHECPYLQDEKSGLFCCLFRRTLGSGADSMPLRCKPCLEVCK